MPSTSRYKSRNKINTTLFHNFLSWNKKLNNKTTKKKSRNKIYFRNGESNKRSVFNEIKISNKKNPLCIFSSLNYEKIKLNNLTESKGKSPDKKNDNNFVVSKYNFPLIYEDNKNEVVF